MTQQPPSDGDPYVPRDIVIELERRIHFWDAPPPGFLPLDHLDDLPLYGLPMLPDPRERPQSYEFWYKLYSPPIQWIQATIAPLPPVQSLRPLMQRWAADATLQESSRNWSGLYITPRDGRMFTEVHGEWTVREPKYPGAGGPPEQYHSSTWIGLDGQRAYHHSSLPQIGTEQYLESGTGGAATPRMRTFWQWWSKELPGQSLPLSAPVNDGDTVMAALVLLSNTVVKFILKNLSTGDVVTPFDVAPPLASVPLKVSGATAEWIVERSTDPYSGNIREFPKFDDTFDFTCCRAVSALTPTGLGRDETLIGARRISMQRVAYSPAPERLARTVTIARPNTIVAPWGEQHEHEFKVEYVP
jgi:hypothetical protein